MPWVQSAELITAGGRRTKLTAAKQKLVIALAKPQYDLSQGLGRSHRGNEAACHLQRGVTRHAEQLPTDGLKRGVAAHLQLHRGGAARGKIPGPTGNPPRWSGCCDEIAAFTSEERNASTSFAPDL